jgi:hypothetical protein
MIVRRIFLVLTVALVMAAMMVASVMPAFAQEQGPEGGNPGEGICTQQERGTAGESGTQPLPFGGTEPEAGFENAPQGVVFTSPGSPFSAENPQEC